MSFVLFVLCCFGSLSFFRFAFFDWWESSCHSGRRQTKGFAMIRITCFAGFRTKTDADSPFCRNHVLRGITDERRRKIRHCIHESRASRDSGRRQTNTAMNVLRAVGRKNVSIQFCRVTALESHHSHTSPSSLGKTYWIILLFPLHRVVYQ